MRPLKQATTSADAEFDNAGATIVVLAMAVGLWIVLAHALQGRGGVAASPVHHAPDVFEWLAMLGGVAIECVSVVILMRLSRPIRAAAAAAVAVAGGNLLPLMVDGSARGYSAFLGAAWAVWLVVLLGIAARGALKQAGS